MFDTPNTCVWNVKQYCLGRQTILFHRSNIGVLCFEYIVLLNKTFVSFFSPLVCRGNYHLKKCDRLSDVTVLLFKLIPFPDICVLAAPLM